jgi:hypothetical protein
VLRRGGGDADRAELGAVPVSEHDDVAEACGPHPRGHGRDGRDGDLLVRIVGQGVEVAVVVVAVADDDPAQHRKVGGARERSRLAVEVARPLGQPGVGEDRGAVEVEEHARVDDSGEGRGHDRPIGRRMSMDSCQ